MAMAGGVTLVTVCALTIFAFQVSSGCNQTEEDNLDCLQTKVDFTAWRGVLLCSLLVLAVCGLVTASVPTDR